MTKVQPINFSPELVAIMKSALDTAVHRIDQSHWTPATTAKMAERIVRTASEGVTDLHELVCAGEGRRLKHVSGQLIQINRRGLAR